MLLSFIIPAYNAQSHIERCINSILNQNLDHADYEIIVVDDGSTDQTASIVSGLVKRFPNIVLLCKSNNGPGAARNTGLRIAQGQYILFIDADDYLIAQSMYNLLHLAIDSDLDILMGDFIHDKNGAIQIKNANFRQNTQEIMSGKQFLKTNEISWTVWVYLFKRDFLSKHGLIFREASNGTDTDFSLKSIFYACKIQYVKTFFYCWVYRKGSVSHSHWTLQKMADAASSLAAMKTFALLVKNEDDLIDLIFGKHMTAKSMGYIKRNTSLGFTQTKLACQWIKNEYIDSRLLVSQSLSSWSMQLLIKTSPSLAAAIMMLAKYVHIRIARLRYTCDS